MLLSVNGLSSRPRLKLHEVTDTPIKGDPWRTRRPKNVIPLGETIWPDEVKKRIAQVFIKIGVEDPYRQKLVEPYAKVFGGKDDDGAYDLKAVDWIKLVDYFTWEAAAWDNDTPAKEKALLSMVANIRKKYGGMFNHQQVYHDGMGI